MKFILKDNEQKEETIELWLKEYADFVVLKAKDKNGREETIMEFENGKFYRYSGIDLKGLEINNSNEIEEKCEKKVNFSRSSLNK